MEGNMSDSHKPPLNADASRVHLCDCNRSFALDAARLSGSAGAALHCHHALCGAELPALEASLASGHTVHVACTQETALFGELAEARTRASASISSICARTPAGRRSPLSQAPSSPR